MTTQEREVILIKAKEFFKEEIVASHIENAKKLTNISEFKVNPFLVQYLARLLTGDSSSESIAKALIYPRILGTSIVTTFGNKMQYFCSTVLSGFASTTSGIDIEFIDQLDMRRKYCQIKAGPNTINKDDIQTILGHFTAVKNLARTNRQVEITLNDLIVGVFYGEPHKLSMHYRNINREHHVYAGKEFWHHLTGEEDFYLNLIDAVAEVASETNGKDMLDGIVQELASNIENSRNQ